MTTDVNSRIRIRCELFVDKTNSLTISVSKERFDIFLFTASQFIESRTYSAEAICRQDYNTEQNTDYDVRYVFINDLTRTLFTEIIMNAEATYNGFEKAIWKALEQLDEDWE